MGKRACLFRWNGQALLRVCGEICGQEKRGLRPLGCAAGLGKYGADGRS